MTGEPKADVRERCWCPRPCLIHDRPDNSGTEDDGPRWRPDRSDDPAVLGLDYDADADQ